jgi:Leucine-rich repeat (LRR) protein
MAIYNEKGKKWETSPINEWESLKLTCPRFFQFDFLNFKVKSLQLTDLKNNNDLKSLAPLNLIELDLKNNFIEHVPTFLGDFYSLKILDLSHNSIRIFPMEISSLRNLETLNISHNELMHFPIGMNHLQTLNMSFNKISAVDCQIFADFSPSSTIYLDGCLFQPNTVQKIMTYLNSIDYTGAKIYLSVSEHSEEINLTNDESWNTLINHLKEEVNTSEIDEIDEIERERERACLQASSAIVTRQPVRRYVERHGSRRAPGLQIKKVVVSSRRSRRAT